MSLFLLALEGVVDVAIHVMEGLVNIGAEAGDGAVDLSVAGGGGRLLLRLLLLGLALLGGGGGDHLPLLRLLVPLGGGRSGFLLFGIPLLGCALLVLILVVGSERGVNVLGGGLGGVANVVANILNGRDEILEEGHDMDNSELKRKLIVFGVISLLRIEWERG